MDLPFGGVGAAGEGKCQVKKIDRNNLPKDLDGCYALISELVDELDLKERKLRRVLHQLEKLMRWRYGPKRERADEHQLFLFAVALVGTDKDIEVKGAEGSKKERKSTPHGRQRLPKHLKRQRVVHDLGPDERHCPECQEVLRHIGEETSERLEYVPASWFVIEDVCEKYACPRGCTVVTAGKPMQAIERGLAGPGLLAHVAVSKYADHQPLHRQEEMYRRQGVRVSRKTMCDWMRRSAELVNPLFEEMKRRVMTSKVLQTDDTPVGVLDPALGRTRTGRIWTYVGDGEHPYTVYDYTPSRSRDGPEAFMEDFSGYLQADAYSGYDRLYKDREREVVEVACWAHARRKFYEAQTSDLMRSMVMLAYIRLLYDVEREARERALDSAGRLALRKEKSVPILKDIKGYLRKEQANVLPKSPEGQAIAYALSNWEALTRYCEDGDLEIDNNGAERSLRGIAIGRKNWMFFGSDTGGRTAAILTSFITTCKRLHVDPFAYLCDVFDRISSHPAKRLEELLPDKWKAAHEGAASH
jgi:transposase